MLSCFEGARRAEGTVVIIDVLRAFTTEAAAFRHGVERLLLTDSRDEAQQWKREGRGALTIGEVHGDPEGFDMDNSPRVFMQGDLRGQTLIHRTSAGTTGIHLVAPQAERVYAASFWVAEATARAIRRDAPEVVSLVAMGVAGAYRADEDELCAYYLRSRLEDRFPDQAAVAELVRDGNTYARYNVAHRDGHPSDGELALQFDVCDFAIRVYEEEGLLVSRPLAVG
jgi:2-phosphosulfolactate phosphatase